MNHAVSKNRLLLTRLGVVLLISFMVIGEAARAILLSLIAAVIYQALVPTTLFPSTAVIVALGLAFVPYLMLRGPVARIAHWWWADLPMKNPL